MKTPRSLYVIFVSAAIALVLSGLPLSGMWKSDGSWARTRQDDELIILAMASKDPTIGIVYLLKNPGDIEKQTHKISALGGTVKHADSKIGYIRAEVPTAAARKALEVGPGDVADIDVDLGSHSQNPHAGTDWYEPPKDGHQFQAETDSEATRKFLETPSPIAHDLGADEWEKEHPTFDGRGVVIADAEINLVDAAAPQFNGALSLDGKPVRKVEGMHIAVDPDDHPIGGVYDSPTLWVDMHTHAKGETVQFEGHEVHLPDSAGDYRIGKFDLTYEARGTHWLNPEVLRPFIGDGMYDVVWEPSTGKVWVDEKHSYDFRTVKPNRDYNAGGEISYFGSREYSKKYPLSIAAIDYVVLVDKPKESVALGLEYGDHATMVLSSAAGHPTGPNDPVHGVAPAAQVSSYKFSSSRAHTQAEALIAAEEDPAVDVIIFEWSSAIHTTSEEGWFLGALNQRLVQTFDKLIFVPGDNQPALGSIDDAGMGPDVIAVSGSQSAESYLLYDGFRPAAAIHKHWGGLTDGPGQDGRLKPDLLAPSGYTSSTPTYIYETDAHRKAGLYTLPPGLQRGGGTSQATPTAAGAAALLISAAKQSGLHIHASQLADAMRLGARMSDDLTAHEQGNGLIDVAASWKILTGESAGSIPALIQPCAGTVHTARWPHGAPDGGRGIFETIGWHPGDSGSRSMRFCTPPAGLTASLLLNDGTFDIDQLQASGKDTELSLKIHPSVAGFHSTIVELKNNAGIVVARGMATIAATAPLNADNKYKFEQKIIVPRPGYVTTFIDVPPGTDALVIEAKGDAPFRLLSQDPAGTDTPGFDWQFAPEHTATVSSPMAGSWELIFDDTHDVWQNTRSLTPVEPQTVSLTVQAVRADRKAGATKNTWADLPIHEIGAVTSLATRDGEISSTDPVLIPVDVPADTGAMMVDVSGSDEAVDVYVLDCRKNTCEPHGRQLGSGDNKRLVVANPDAGKFIVALDKYDPMHPSAGTAKYKVSVLAYSRFGHVEPSAQVPGRAYEVNCKASGATVVAAPACGLFITNGGE